MIVALFVCVFILLIGVIFALCLDEPFIMIGSLVIVLVIFGFSSIIIYTIENPDSTQEKCICETVETCEDCGGIIE